MYESGSTEKDKRGKHNSKNRKKVSEEDKTIDRTHINYFHRLESHYLRNQTKKEFMVA